MKPIKPYVDYYITDDNNYNCRRYSSDRTTTCRYVRLTGDSCDKLTDYYAYTDNNFTTRAITTSNSLGSNPQIIMTNCSNQSTNNYNPGIENILLSNTIIVIALLFVFILFYLVTRLIKLPSIWSRK